MFQFLLLERTHIQKYPCLLPNLNIDIYLAGDLNIDIYPGDLNIDIYAGCDLNSKLGRGREAAVLFILQRLPPPSADRINRDGRGRRKGEETQ